MTARRRAARSAGRGGLSDARLSSIACALAVVITVLAIGESARCGRLARVPRVDDVLYLARGARLYQAFEARGVAGLLRDYAHEPPHSPYASGLSATAMATFGFDPRAPYVLTALAIGAYLVCAARTARTAARGWTRVALVLLAAGQPFLAASAQNLKPDYACGIATAAGMMVLLRRPLGPAKRAAVAGALFGLALVIKPAMFLPTSLLLAGTLGLCAARDVVVAGRAAMTTAVRHALMGALVSGLVCAAVALPHFALSWRTQVGYVTSVLEGGEDGAPSPWRYPGSAWDHARYYLTGPGGRLMLDGSRGLGPCLVMIGVAGATALLFGRRRTRAYATAGGLALAMAYLGPTISSVKIAQFAAPMTALLGLQAVQAGAWLSRLELRRRWRAAGLGPIWAPRWMPGWASVLIAAMVLLRAGTYRWTFPRMPADPAAPERRLEHARSELVRAVWAAVLAEAAGRGARNPCRVLVTGGPGVIDEPLLALWGVRDRAAVETRVARGMPSGTADAALAWADVVITNQGATGLTVAKRSVPDADAAWAAALAADAGWANVLRVTAPGTDQAVEVWRRSKR